MERSVHSLPAVTLEDNELQKSEQYFSWIKKNPKFHETQSYFFSANLCRSQCCGLVGAVDWPRSGKGGTEI